MTSCRPSVSPIFFSKNLHSIAHWTACWGPDSKADNAIWSRTRVFLGQVQDVYGGDWSAMRQAGTLMIPVQR